MSSPIEISIIVPAHNVAAYIAATLESIRSQSFNNWECIIIDDGSTDETVAVVKRTTAGDRRFRMIRQSCGGASKARNRGFMESSPFSRYVTFMDADDVWELDALAVLFERISAHPEAAGAHGLAELIDGQGRSLEPGNFSAFGRRRLGYRDGKIGEWPLVDPTSFDTLMWTGPLYPPGLLLARREAYEKVGLYDPKLRQCEDWDMAIRLSRFGPMEFVNKVILQYRRHGMNLSNDVIANRRAVRRVHFKTFFSLENSAEQRIRLTASWRAWQRFKINEKWTAVLSEGRPGAPLRFLKTAVDFPVHLLRYLRGHPSVLGI